jgi:hypothetical protein
MGTPDEIVDRRALRVAELEVDEAPEAATLLRALPDVEEVAHYGHLLRLATKRRVDPVALAREALERHAIPVHRSREARATVEDAFVSMVRADA